MRALFTGLTTGPKINPGTRKTKTLYKNQTQTLNPIHRLWTKTESLCCASPGPLQPKKRRKPFPRETAVYSVCPPHPPRKRTQLGPALIFWEEEWRDPSLLLLSRFFLSIWTDILLGGGRWVKITTLPKIVDSGVKLAL